MRLDVSPWARYAEGLCEGRLLYQFCRECARPIFHPRVVCPYGGCTEMEWRVASGSATLHAVTWIATRDSSPYSIALVDLQEGVRVMTRLTGLTPQTAMIGMALSLEGHETDADENPYPVFGPSGEQP